MTNYINRIARDTGNPRLSAELQDAARACGKQRHPWMVKLIPVRGGLTCM